MLNEQEVVDALLQAWDVNVSVTTFAMPLRDAITLMQETDVLIGMHGAGKPCRNPKPYTLNPEP